MINVKKECKMGEIFVAFPEYLNFIHCGIDILYNVKRHNHNSSVENRTTYNYLEKVAELFLKKSVWKSEEDSLMMTFIHFFYGKSVAFSEK